MGRRTWITTIALLGMLPAGAAAQEDACSARAPDAQPGTAAWTARDAQNVVCAEQRALDTAAEEPRVGESSVPLRDLGRDPRTLPGRWRYETTEVTNRSGSVLAAEVFRPAAEVPGPYPAVVIVHGGGSGKELHWWASEALAEAGYLVVAFDVAENSGGDHATDAQDVIDWLHSDAFPFRSELDRNRVGIAGHSQGASTASLLGQLDPRLKAIVAWDNLTALDPELWADDIGVDPPGTVPWHAPALGIGADYYFVPGPLTEAPEPAKSNGEGGRGRGFRPHPKDLGYQEVRRNGLDTALFVLRAGTHLDFTPTTKSPSSRFGEAVATYLTRAWFDRYLKGIGDPALQRDAHRRLVGATRFDASADLTGARQPLAGRSMCDRMSFLFGSRFSVRDPGAPDAPPAESPDWRTDCYAGRTVAPVAPVASAPRRSRRTVTVTVRGLRGVEVRRVTATVGRRPVGRSRGRRVVLRFAGRPCGPVRVRLAIAGRRRDGRAVRVTQRRTFRLCG